ncbi:MAG: AMP-binding protein, partial [Terriglobia bacterium]
MNLPLTPLRYKRRAAQLFGRKQGVVCGENRFTYQEFDQRCDRFSAALLQLGVRPGDRVSFLSPNCHRLLEAYYAVPQIGAILLPLNVRLTAAELIQILHDAAPRLLFFDTEFDGEAKKMTHADLPIEDFICLDHPRPSGWSGKTYEELLESSLPRAFDWTTLDENSVAELFYTSGTTALPKGVMLTHRSLYLHALYVAHARKMSDADAEAYTIPLFHVNSWGAPHTLTLSGARHVILRKFNPPTLLSLIEQERITRLQMVPSMAIALINHPGIEQCDLASVKEVMIGGAPANQALMRQLEERFPGAVVAGGYGLTETSPVVSIAYLKEHLKNEPHDEQLRRTSTAGYAITGVEVRLAALDGSEVPADGST